MKRVYILKTCLSLFALTISLCFVFYGTTQALLGSTEILPTLFGIYSFSFGAISILFIVITLISAKKTNITIVKYLGIGFIIFYIIGAIDSSRISGQEMLGFAITATLVLLNWLAIKRIALAA
jgi:hypothetical protein